MPEHNLVNRPAGVTSLIIPLRYQPIGEVSHAAVISHLAGKPIGKCYSTGKGLTLLLLMLILPHLLLPLSKSSVRTHTHAQTQNTAEAKQPCIAKIHFRVLGFWQ